MTYSAIYRQKRLLAEANERILFEQYERSILERNHRLLYSILSEDEIIEYSLGSDKNILLSEILGFGSKGPSLSDLQSLTRTTTRAKQSVDKLVSTINPRVNDVIEPYLLALSEALGNVIRRSAEIKIGKDATNLKLTVGSAIVVESRATSFIKALNTIFSTFVGGLSDVVEPDDRDKTLEELSEDPDFPRVEKLKNGFRKILQDARKEMRKADKESFPDWKWLNTVKKKVSWVTGRSEDRGKAITMDEIDNKMPDLDALFEDSLLKMTYNEMAQSVRLIKGASSNISGGAGASAGGGGSAGRSGTAGGAGSGAGGGGSAGGGDSRVRSARDLRRRARSAGSQSDDTDTSGDADRDSVLRGKNRNQTTDTSAPDAEPADTDAEPTDTSAPESGSPRAGAGGGSGGGGAPPTIEPIPGDKWRKIFRQYGDAYVNKDKNEKQATLIKMRDLVNNKAGTKILESKNRDDQVILERWNYLAGTKDED